MATYMFYNVLYRIAETHVFCPCPVSGEPRGDEHRKDARYRYLGGAPSELSLVLGQLLRFSLRGEDATGGSLLYFGGVRLALLIRRALY